MSEHISTNWDARQTNDYEDWESAKQEFFKFVDEARAALKKHRQEIGASVLHIVNFLAFEVKVAEFMQKLFGKPFMDMHEAQVKVIVDRMTTDLRSENHIELDELAWWEKLFDFPGYVWNKIVQALGWGGNKEQKVNQSSYPPNNTVAPSASP